MVGGEVDRLRARLLDLAETFSRNSAAAQDGANDDETVMSSTEEAENAGAAHAWFEAAEALLAVLGERRRRLVTADEAAALLGVGRDTWYAYRHLRGRPAPVWRNPATGLQEWDREAVTAWHATRPGRGWRGSRPPPPT